MECVGGRRAEDEVRSEAFRCSLSVRHLGDPHDIWRGPLGGINCSRADRPVTRGSPVCEKLCVSVLLGTAAGGGPPSAAPRTGPWLLYLPVEPSGNFSFVVKLSLLKNNCI